MRPPELPSEVVAAARRGDRAALDAVLRAHQPSVHALCRRLLDHDADAADATQEALIAVARGIGRFDGRSALSTWIYRVATNAALDELRRRRRRPPATDLDEVDVADAGPRGSAPPATERVADRLVLDEALARLRPEFRAPVVLRDVLGLDYAEIAEVLDLAPGTVRSRISRGRAALADTLRPDVDDEHPTGNHRAVQDVTTGTDPT